MKTDVTSTMNADGLVETHITSDCPHIQTAAEKLTVVDPFQEISFQAQPNGPKIIAVMQEVCPHPSCPVFSGILKTVEIAAGLALPTEVRITFES
ncbi:MAG: hypothetical protein PF495_19855 [Spirochaetales bacterium]|nr:hypothetical protein [Spirochaetales bacterium]